jgi:hypothetical protein
MRCAQPRGAAPGAWCQTWGRQRMPPDSRLMTSIAPDCAVLPVGGVMGGAGESEGAGGALRAWRSRQASVIGRRRMRLPVAAWIALASAGMTGGSEGSPRPVGGKSVMRNSRVILGVVSMRGNG